MTERAPTVRDARPDELATVMNVLDGAALEVDAATVGERIPGGVLVAVAGDRVIGACLVAPVGPDAQDGTDGDGGRGPSAHVEAVAVRPGRRGQGIGTSLVEAAADRWGALSAEFDEGNRPFYASLGFDVEPVDEGRLRGIHPAKDGDRARRSPERR